MKKLLLILLCLPMIGFAWDIREYKKSNHSILLGLNKKYSLFESYERSTKAIGFDLSYSFVLASQSNWRYSPYFTYNYIYEKQEMEMLYSAEVNDPVISPLYVSYRKSFFIGQKFGHIHNEMFSTYIGASIGYSSIKSTWTNSDYEFSSGSISSYIELEERLSFNKIHFIFLNIRTRVLKREQLKNELLGAGWFTVIEPTIGYGITF